MDGTTEPIIAVIGHPIAGNPSQFAIERGLDSMGLDWRVLSFDVHPENIAAALEGFKVTGIAGVLIDASIRDVASKWYAAKHVSASLDGGAVREIDCLYRDEQLELIGSNEASDWLLDSIVDRIDKQRLWMGKRDVTLITPDEGYVSVTAERLPDAKLIVVGPYDDDETALIEAGEWPVGNDSITVIDLSSDTWPTETFDADVLSELGYNVINIDHIRIGTLSRMLARWTGKTCSNDVLADAIEEYLGV